MSSSTLMMLMILECSHAKCDEFGKKCCCQDFNQVHEHDTTQTKTEKRHLLCQLCVRCVCVYVCQQLASVALKINHKRTETSLVQSNNIKCEQIVVTIGMFFFYRFLFLPNFMVVAVVPFGGRNFCGEFWGKFSGQNKSSNTLIYIGLKSFSHCFNTEREIFFSAVSVSASDP